MKTIKLLLIPFITTLSSFAQSNWTTSPFDSKVFIENKGQFDGVPVRGQVLYGIQNAGETILFTTKGVSFVYPVSKDNPNRDPSPAKPSFGKDKYPVSQTLPSENMEKEKDQPDGEIILISMQWLGANQDVRVYAENPASDFYRYSNSSSEHLVLPCTAYKKIIYKNIYPGVDIEYSFHEEQGIRGLKYILILHPGADHAAIKMVYSGQEKIYLDERKNIRIQCPAGEIIDHAPETFYQPVPNTTESDKTTVGSSFLLDNHTVTFRIEQYDTSRTVIIDPWTISPGFVTTNKGYDLERNPTTGEIFVYGGSPPYQLKKLDASGNVLWTYTATPLLNSNPVQNYYGDIAIDPAGDVYLSAGCCNANGNTSLMKINGNSFSVIWLSSSIGNNEEPWRMKFDAPNNRMIVAGCALGASANNDNDNIQSIDPGNGILLSSATIIAPLDEAEIRSFTIAPNGNIYAIHVCKLPSFSTANNRVSAITPAFTSIYNVPSGYVLEELGASYATPPAFHGFNGIAVNANYIYTYDGSVIYKRNITNGTAVGNVTVAGGITAKNSGIILDACGNIYVGTQNEIHHYDSTLAFVSSVSVPGSVYDLALGGATGEILACGNGFVVSVNFSGCNILTITTTTTSLLCNGQCIGTAVITPTNGTSPYTYNWSNGQITQTATGLCANTYSVLITDGAGSTATATVTVTQPAALSASVTVTNSNCNAQCNGSSVITAGGGTPGYTYNWSTIPLQTSASATGLCAGNYTITIADANNCIATQTIAITEPAPITVSQSASLCSGFTYTLPGGTVVNTGGIYTDTLTSNGCDSIIITTLTVDSVLAENQSASICSGTTYTLPGGTVVSTAGIYTDTLPSVSGCDSLITTTALTVNPSPTAAAFSNVTITQGQSVTLTASGGGTYSWSSGSSSSFITITPLVTTIYCVTVTDENNCTDTACVTVSVEPLNCNGAGEIYLPNAFSPNNDGENDVLKIYYSNIQCIKTLKLIIYNRWGEKVFETKNPVAEWDGSYRSKIENTAVFVYYLEATLISGEEIIKKGNVGLIK